MSWWRSHLSSHLCLHEGMAGQGLLIFFCVDLPVWNWRPLCACLYIVCRWLFEIGGLWFICACGVCECTCLKLEVWCVHLCMWLYLSETGGLWCVWVCGCVWNKRLLMCLGVWCVWIYLSETGGLWCDCLCSECECTCLKLESSDIFACLVCVAVSVWNKRPLMYLGVLHA